MIGKKAREQLGVSPRKGLALAIAFAQIVRRQRLAQQLCCLCHQLVRALGKSNVRYRRVRFAIGRDGKRRKLEFIREQQRLIDFGQVVVFRGHPEDRNARDASTLHLLRQRQHRGGLKQRQQWPAEKPHLLSCYYSESTFAQAPNVVQGLLRGSPGSILLLQHVGDSNVDLGPVRYRLNSGQQPAPASGG